MRRQYMWAGLAGVILAAVIGLWLVLSPGWALALVKDKMTRGLGRELSVAAGAQIEFSPDLALRLDRVSLAGASLMDEPFITASSLRVPLTVSGLFSHSLDLSQIKLVDAEIGLIIDEMGRTSWPETQTPEPASGRLLLENAAIRFFDRRSGQAFAVNGANMAVDISATGELTVNGAATINHQHAKLQAYVKNVARVSATGSPAELAMESPALSANFNGRLATANGLSLAGTVALSGPDLRGALRWAGGAPGGTLGLKTFNLTGGLDATARAFGVEDAEITVDGISGKGDLTLDFRGETPKLQAVIATGTLDLDRYVPAAGGSDLDWGTARLGFSALRGVDAAVTLDTANLIYSGAAFGPAKIAANLVAGRLEARIVAGSSAEASILLDGSGPIDEFALVAAGRNANATELFGPLSGITWLDGGADFNATISGTGKTQQEMVSTLKGEVQIAINNGWLRGLDMGLGLSAVAREIQKGWPGAGKGETPFSSLAASFTIADGIAAMKTLNLQSPAVTMTGTGEIDLLRRALDLRVDPRLVASGQTTGLPVPIVVKGPWASPRLYPDMANIVSNPKAAYDALKGMGLPSR